MPVFSDKPNTTRIVQPGVLKYFAQVLNPIFERSIFGGMHTGENKPIPCQQAQAQDQLSVHFLSKEPATSKPASEQTSPATC